MSTSPFVHHEYSYDKLDRLGSMTANGITTNYTYDRNGRLLSGNSGGFNTAYTYNLGGMVTGLTTQKGNTAIQSHSYTYLPNGNISGKQSTVGTQTTNYAYQYDKAGRLTNETINSAPTAYTYDAWGNRASMTGNGTSSTYTYDANNRLTKSITEEGSTTTTADYYYDHNGNQITKAVNVTTPQSGIAAYLMSPQTNGYLSMYEYDSYNRLKSADTDGTVTTYTYDGNNLRQSKTSNGITTQHIWDGDNMVMDGTNKFYRGATGIEFATLNGNTSFYHKDAHGDVTALTDTAGTITQSYIYDAFGNQMNENENDINPFRYCGEYLDSETGLIYLRNRYYDNSIGRFITEDPIKDGLNWYVYCGNNPLNHIDPLGLFYEDVEEALQIIIDNKSRMMTPGTPEHEYWTSYSNILVAKEKIEDDVIYVENWVGMRDVLSPLIEGDNNSLDNIKTMKNEVVEAKEQYYKDHMVDDVIFIAGMTTVIVAGAKFAKAGTSLVGKESGIKFADEAAKHLLEKGRYVPITILQEAIKHGVPMPDPQGSRATMYYIEMFKNGTPYTLEVLYDKISNSIWHFLYK